MKEDGYTITIANGTYERYQEEGSEEDLVQELNFMNEFQM